ncbi:unnamed protein product [Meganyctiphanes norvegica]|uniref:protein-serine/threonine phosphatase n=1 Tax=Meganyctiphanes norvegica TaxID=48144 RepID=A0AAV2RP38_MEGNR
MVRARVQRCSSGELKRLLLEPSGGRYYPPTNPYDEVFPGVLLADADTALSTSVLKDLGVTHVLNAAQGHNSDVYGGYVNTNMSYYRRHNIGFLGIPAMDMPAFYMKPYFEEAAEFINNALKMNGKVLVHCQCGISRSAALVLAFLILKRGMTVQTAMATVSARRNIFPNQGFMEQLCDLDYEQRTSGRTQEANTFHNMPRRSSSPSPIRDYCRRPEIPTTSTYTSSPYLSSSYSNSNSSANTYPKYFSTRLMGRNTTPFESPYVARRAQSVDRFVPTQTYSRYDAGLQAISTSMDALPSSPYHYRSTVPRSVSPSPASTSYRSASLPSAYFNRYSTSAGRYRNESSDSEDDGDHRDKLPLNSVHSSYRPHNYIAGTVRGRSEVNKGGYKSTQSAKANYCSRVPFDSYDKSATTKDLYNRYRLKPNYSVEDNPATSKTGYSSYNGSLSYPNSLFANGIPTYNQYLTRTSSAYTPEALTYNNYSTPLVPRVHA